MSALPASAEPTVIGPYEVTGLLGRGGMGVVHRATHRETGLPVALKTASAKDADLFASMRREIHALGRLRHAGVVRIIEEGVDGGIPWYAMELLDQAEPLRAILDRSRNALPFDGRPRVREDLPQMLTLMHRLCRVLAHIHRHGVVHRDLKPENVLVADGHHPILVDFGLMARFRGDSSREVLEVGGKSTGTLAYASPEQVDGQLVDARTDIYSFGVMLYETLAGRLPFDTSSSARLLQQLFFELPPPPSHWVEGVPPLLDELVLRLMQKKPRDRYGYADDVAAMLVEAGAEPEVATATEDDGASYLYRPELEGRDAILDSLTQRLDGVRQGSGAFVVLGGVSGIGKTSVATTFSRKAMRKKMLVLTGECVPVSGDVGGEPLHPLRPLLHAIADHCLLRGGAEFDRVIGPRLTILKEYHPGLAELARTRGDEGLHVGAAAVRRRLFEDLAETVVAFAANQTVLLILDDLQWADEVTLRFLASLRRDFFHGTKLMILGLYRSDEVSPELNDLLAAPHLAKLSLERLDDGSLGAIVKSMLAESDPSPPFVRFVAQRSEGNPFFVAEYLRAAVSERLLHREGGRWRVRQGDGDDVWTKLGRPGSVIDLVGHRLAALSDETRRVAEAAAVLGRELEESLLLAAAGAGEAETMEAISDLVERQVLEQQGPRLRFVHDKPREALYSKLDAERRSELHRRAAMAVEARWHQPGAPQPNFAELAHHWEVAGEIAQAIDYYETAGQHALRNGAGREASDYLQRVLALDGDPSPHDPQRRLRRARWHRLLSAARWALSDFPGSVQHAHAVLALAGMPLPASKFGRKRVMLGQIAQQAMHLLLPRALYRSRASRWPMLAEAATCAERLAEHAYYAEDVPTMVGAGLLAVNLSERIGEEQNVARAYSMLGIIANLSGLKGVARRYLESGYQIARKAGDVEGQIHAGYCASVYYVGLGNWDLACRSANDAIALGRRFGDHQEREIAETILGHAQHHSGQIDESLRTYATVRDSARKRSNLQHESWAQIGVGRALLMLGRVDEADAALEAARRLYEMQPDHIAEVCNTGNLTILHLQRDLDLAKETADYTYTMTSSSPLVQFDMFRGLAAPAEVYLATWHRAREKQDAAEIERMRTTVLPICAKLHKAAFIFPMVQPHAFRLSGIARCLDGDVRRGRRLLEKAVSAASRLAMPVEEASSRLDLALYADLDPAERTAHCERARALFESSGCSSYFRNRTSQWRAS